MLSVKIDDLDGYRFGWDKKAGSEDYTILIQNQRTSNFLVQLFNLKSLLNFKLFKSFLSARPYNHRRKVSNKDVLLLKKQYVYLRQSIPHEKPLI